MTERMKIYYSPLALSHATGAGVFEAASSPLLARDELHPENAERIENMRSALRKGPIADRLDWDEAPPASDEAMSRFHEPAYLASLRAIPQTETRRLTATTVFGPGSYAAVAAAAGQAMAALDHVWRGDGRLAYALVRPPGHHAQPAICGLFSWCRNWVYRTALSYYLDYLTYTGSFSAIFTTA